MPHIPEIEFDHALARNRVIGYGSRIGSQSPVNGMFKRRILDSADGAATFIAPTTKITGTLAGKGSYVFCGEMDGNCDIDGPVTLAAGARWKGTLRASDVIVAGRIDGDVIANHRIEVSETAHIAGSLAGRSIAVAEGAVIEGDIKVTNGSAPQGFKEKRETSEAV
ncbi:MAG: polymer-forming cytoskeletal protein [Gammaproteobacteria bacterium]|nr:polymer-forming cytoskeletal protein [Gammaproteobacteria bacterium]